MMTTEATRVFEAFQKLLFYNNTENQITDTCDPV